MHICGPCYCLHLNKDLPFSTLQAVLDFVQSVVHVSTLNTLDEMDTSVVICCLAQGQISAFNVTKVIKKYVKNASVKYMYFTIAVMQSS